MALSDDKDVTELDSSFSMEHALAGTDSTQYYRGGLVCIKGSTGKVVKGAVAADLTPIGRCEERILTGSSTTHKVKARSGIFLFKNSSAGDAIAATEIGKDCYIVDDETVAKTSDTAARSAAGKVYDVTSAGVWVAVRFPL
ncbi:MAG: hypothetical protein KF718_33250 [Polyangiaceae bacterium]|nr:hypothetical protein [Polyangiaceae bacterium]